jgi:hypothetical protein
MDDDAILTVLWTDRGEQRYLLVHGAADPDRFLPWLQAHRPALEGALQDPSPGSRLRELPESEAQGLLCGDQPRVRYRYLLTITLHRRRALLSAWRWHDDAGAWQRLWLPREVWPSPDP